MSWRKDMKGWADEPVQRTPSEKGGKVVRGLRVWGARILRFIIVLSLLLNNIFMLIKYYLLLFLLSTTITISFAQNQPENITNHFFEIYKTGNSDKALDYIFSTNKYAKESEKSINELKRNLSNAINAYGPFIDFELLSKKTAGNSLVLYTFIARHDRTPLTFRIFLYKPKDYWQLQNITFDNKIDEELDEASKLYKSHP